MRRPHDHLTAADRATIAQWRRRVLAFYGVIALTFVIGGTADRYISSAIAAKSAVIQPAAGTADETAATNPVAVVEPAQQPTTTFQTASDAGTSEALAENAWDFNHPETIPGFGPMTPAAPRHAQQERKLETATAAQSQERPTVDIRALLDDPAIRAQAGLAENQWDFNAPDSIPGFGSMPPADEPRRVARAAKNADDAESSSSTER